MTITDPEREFVAREALLTTTTKEIRQTMDKIFGERVTKSESNTDFLPGIPSNSLDVELLTEIRILLATLHDDGFWDNTDEQRFLTEQAIERNQIQLGTSAQEPEQGTELLFSGNDKYGLVFGMTYDSESVPQEQMDREAERMYLGWYVELFNRYIHERPKEMYRIARRIQTAGLPLQPWIQAWIKQQK